MAAPITLTTALNNAASQAAAANLNQEHAERLAVDVLDIYQSYWSRDPGRAHGPYS